MNGIRKLEYLIRHINVGVYKVKRPIISNDFNNKWRVWRGTLTFWRGECCRGVFNNKWRVWRGTLTFWRGECCRGDFNNKWRVWRGTLTFWRGECSFEVEIVENWILFWRTILFVSHFRPAKKTMEKLFSIIW